MSDKQQPINLAPTEWEVMKILWDRGPLAARDVFAALPPEIEWAYKTVKTLLARLVAKGPSSTSRLAIRISIARRSPAS